jgi:hypothetical protein
MFPIDFLLLGQKNPYTAWPGPQIWLTRRGKCGKDEEIVVYHLQGPDISTEKTIQEWPQGEPPAKLTHLHVGELGFMEDITN